jgi:molecular chaperone GrpE
MTNEDESLDIAPTGDAIELDTDETSEIDAAMRDALEAIEAGEREARTEIASAEPIEEPIEEPGTEAQDLTAQVENYRERALRALADLENYRKRVQREREEESRFKALEPMREFLAVADNLERALAADGSIDDLKQGVEMILRQMGNLMRGHGVERIESVGQAFDPSVHEAVSSEEDPRVDGPTVSEEMQAGYTMHGRLLRPAVVKVSMPSGGRRGDA